MTETDKPVCPECQQPAIPIGYGYPGPEMIDAAQKGEIRLGGCIVWDDMPTHTCHNGHSWRDGDNTVRTTRTRPGFGGDWDDEPPF